jgi:hypothetical protein
MMVTQAIYIDGKIQRLGFSHQYKAKLDYYRAETSWVLREVW